ncbi:MAG: alpha/beta hydrolase [Actinomycetia bacterium]|nr:alpha/beta hydrolase [Actinomycetes bacterium]
MGSDQTSRRVHLRTGVSLAYIEQGNRSGSSVLLLHAWGESLGSFDPLMPQLTGSPHLVAVDQRGHGLADKPTDGYDLDSLAADVEAFMDAVELRSVVLVGSSSGGYVAQQLVLRAPDRVEGLVLVGSPRSLRGQHPLAAELQRLTDPVDPGWVREFLALFPLCHEVPQWYLDDRVRDATLMPADVWRASFAGLTTSPAPTDIGRITVPTLIIWGDRDGLLTRQDQDALALRIGGSTLVVYEGVGHLVLWEQPGRVAADISAFIRALAANGHPGSLHR